MKRPERIMIRNSKTGKFFGFITQFPGICAEGESKAEVRERIERYWREFVAKIESDQSMEELESTI